MKHRYDAAQMLFEETVKSLDFGRKDDVNLVKEALVDGYVDDSLLSLFRGQQNEHLRLKIFEKAMGQFKTFKDYLCKNKSRVVKAVVDGGHCKLLRALVKELKVEEEILTKHHGKYGVMSISVFT